MAQNDGQPRQGALPTSYWLAGETVADRHTLFLPPDLGAGEYGLYLCLYRPETAERLPVRGPRGEAPAAREVRLLGVTMTGQGAPPELAPETALADALADPVDVSQVAAQGRLAVEGALVDGLKAVDRELGGDRRDEGLQLLEDQVLALDASSLPGLLRQVRAEEAGGADAASVAALRERLQHFALESVVVPADARLGLYLGDAMAGLVEDGTWTRETLLNVVSYQVWRFSEGRGAPGLARVLEALLQRYPADADLLFFEAERLHRSRALDDAQAAYERVVAVDPGYGPAVLRLGAVAEAQGELAQARERYAAYRQVVPGDLLGLKRLSEVSAVLGTEDAAVLAEQLAAKTDDRRLVAELLGVPVEAVELGPNLVENGGFEEWVGDRPLGWAWSAMCNEVPFGAAVFSASADALPAFVGQQSARVDCLWVSADASESRPRAGFWQTTRGQDAHASMTVAADTPCFCSLYYRTAAGTAQKATVWLSSEPGVLWRADHALEPSDGSWWHFAVVAWNRTTLDAVIRPLLRSWGEGAASYDDVQIRTVHLAGATVVPTGDPRFQTLNADTSLH